MKKQRFDITNTILGWLATAVVLLVLDLFWLGLFARAFYVEHMGALLRPQADHLAAGLFYLFYVSVIWGHSVRDSESPRQSQRKGALLGFVCYGVYELTNWAVIAGWPAILVPVDWAWGVVLTGTAAAAGRFVSRSGGEGQDADD